LKEYYLRQKIEFRIITIISFWIIQGLIINHFLVETNHGNNDSETDAVILLMATGVLLLSAIVMLIVSFYLENKSNWRLVFAISILLIPIFWYILILNLGNPLYFFSK
jgi:hypothetical protein